VAFFALFPVGALEELIFIFREEIAVDLPAEE
jgi:hypothetical protein